MMKLHGERVFLLLILVSPACQAAKIASIPIRTFELHANMSIDDVHSIYPALLGPEITPGPFEEYRRFSGPIFDQERKITAVRDDQELLLIPHDLTSGDNIAFIQLPREGKTRLFSLTHILASRFEEFLRNNEGGKAFDFIRAASLNQRIFDGFVASVGKGEDLSHTIYQPGMSAYAVLYHHKPPALRSEPEARHAMLNIALQAGQFSINRIAADWGKDVDQAKAIIRGSPELFHEISAEIFGITRQRAESEMYRLYRLIATFMDIDFAFSPIKLWEQYLLRPVEFKEIFGKADPTQEDRINKDLLRHQRPILEVALTNAPESAETLEAKAHFESVQALLILVEAEVFSSRVDDNSLRTAVAQLKTVAERLPELAAQIHKRIERVPAWARVTQ